MNIPGPQNARGKILYNVTAKPGQYKEVTVLDISDYHGQLVPLTEAADNLAAPAVNLTFSIGGSACLKTWFDDYRAEAQGGSVTMAAGDSVGATPPISAFFGDTPTMEMMNLMGFQLDGLGNHNFDKGSAYLRNTLIPLANFPFTSANVVDARIENITFLGSVLMRSSLGAAGIGFFGLIVLSLASIVPTLTTWLPAGLIAIAKAVALGTTRDPELDPARTIGISQTWFTR